jgi:hypothetical protein
MEYDETFNMYSSPKYTKLFCNGKSHFCILPTKDLLNSRQMKFLGLCNGHEEERPHGQAAISYQPVKLKDSPAEEINVISNIRYLHLVL